ncbi:MAG: response regulator transcription factor [Planctomycetota bacterium]|jgi:two-component system response regulator FixJ
MDKTSNHIYLIDDDALYRKSLVRLLASVGYYVESFSSAQSFLDSIHVACKTGVLILDLRMPDMDGFALQKRLNELKSRFQIIFITADAQPGDREHALQSGAMAFLQKPFKQNRRWARTIKKMIKADLKSAQERFQRFLVSL